MSSIEYENAKKLVRKYEGKKEIEKEKKLGQWIEDNIGNVFVYRNNQYGGDSPKWDVFKQIIAKKNNSTAIVIEWELIDPKNKVFQIEQKEHYLYSWNADQKNLDHCPPCSLQEFEKMKARIMRLLTVSNKGDAS